ncbi:NAD(P)/FAD-dependent oxidoreductase [Mollicutes bacterium LVI A0039]|nr:NAD(P)/FAD-dependent oxidoreductase [Mollicutes bacterium LVI A0039]
MKKYDVIIVGAGPAGVYASYEFIENSDKQVLLVDKGLDIYKRSCPILEGKLDKCPVATRKKDYAGCFPACSITDGFGGAGAYSDGKFNITTEFGGWLTDYLDDAKVMELIKRVDNINLEHGAPDTITDPTTDHVLEIEKIGYAKGLKLLRSKVRHLGTEINLKILQSIYETLKAKVDFMFRTEVIDLVIEDNKIVGITTANETIYADEVILAVGRDGSKWLKDIATKYDISTGQNQVDIGVRVETSDIVMQDINKHLYEGKFIFNTSVGTTVRTFCSNPSGHVVVENHSGTMLANGHAYKDKSKGSSNTNFALLVSHKLTDFDDPNLYAHTVSKLANQISNGSIIIQSYGDIIKGRRSTQKRIDELFINPTQATAVPGDLGLVLPYNTMRSLIEMMEALDHVTPGIASEHTLFYGVEAKFYSSRFAVDNNFETTIKGLYLAGDGAGLTRGLSQAGANGIAIARHIISK